MFLMLKSNAACCANAAGAAAMAAHVARERIFIESSISGNGNRSLERDFGRHERLPSAEHGVPLTNAVGDDYDDGDHEKRRDGRIEVVVKYHPARGVDGGNRSRQRARRDLILEHVRMRQEAELR